MADILIVDDELGIRELLSEVLEDEGHSITLAENANQARAARADGQHDLILLDIWMPDTDGVTLLKEWNAAGTLTMPVVMMSGHATIDTAVEATRIGAFDFLEKPIALAKLLKTVQAALARAQAQKAWRAAVAQAQAQTAPAVVEAPPTPDPLELAREALAQVDLDQPLREAREAFERIYLEYQLEKEGGSMTKLAERSGLERTHLYRKIRQLGMEPHKQSSRKAVA
ncbi:MAG: response regulator [Burkholderiaceae bacterium]|jgi:DNA-binding NtrC family response regulator